MRFGFVTAVQLGLSCMEAIYRVGGRLDFAMTLEDTMARDKSGRVYIDAFCTSQGVPLTKIRNINSDAALAAVKDAELDWLFIIGWSQIAKVALLSLPHQGVLGMHPTLLPQGRGRAAVPWAILKGLTQTGVSLFKLDDGVDTGPVLLQQQIALTEDMDATRLYALVEQAHAELMEQAFPLLLSGSAQFQTQDESKASVWPGRKPEDGALDLAGKVNDAERLVRAVTRPYPGAFVDLPDRRRIIWKAKVAGPADAIDANALAFSDGHLICMEWEDRLR